MLRKEMELISFSSQGISGLTAVLRLRLINDGGNLRQYIR